MDLAVYMIIATFVTFAVGALFVLVWSIAEGHWSHLSDAKWVVLDDDDLDQYAQGR